MSQDKSLDALEAMGLTFDEVEAADKAIVNKSKSGGRDKRICVCGHAVSKHTTYAGILTCKPSAMLCPCKKIHPVLTADDTRMFLRKTEGAGAMHALSRGIYACISAGKGVEWIIELACARCGKNDSKVVPVPVSASGRASDGPTGFDALLCSSCRTEV